MGAIERSNITAYGTFTKEGIKINRKNPEGNGYTKTVIAGYTGKLEDLSIRFKEENKEYDIPAEYQYVLVLADTDSSEVVAFTFSEGNGGARIFANAMAGGGFTKGCDVKITHSLKTGNIYVTNSLDNDAELPPLKYPFVDGLEKGAPEAPLTGETGKNGPLRDYTRKNLFFREVMMEGIGKIMGKNVNLESRPEAAAQRMEAAMAVLAAVKGRNKEAKLDNFQDKADEVLAGFAFTFASIEDQNNFRKRLSEEYTALGGEGILYPPLQRPSYAVEKEIESKDVDQDVPVNANITEEEQIEF